ncbi:MAG: DUF3999 domain-containing protein [Synergistaceae bacterium]|jgi:hypothetical protein|nr:DUF3999 domain-containing protein [Synergistaceae bacterium]
MTRWLWKSTGFTLCTLLLLSVAAEGAWVPAQHGKPEPVTLRDFVQALYLRTALEGAIYRLSLPKIVYEGLIQSQRYDLAVFNANGEVTPFVVTEPLARSAVERVERDVPFYELPSAESPVGPNPVGPVDIYVRTDADGQVISVTGRGRGGEARERRYLLDFSSVQLSGNADGYTLTLSLPDDTAELSAQMSLFESSNLREWVPFLTDAPLIQLHNKDSRLTRDSVELPRAPQRYLLLRIKGASFNLKSVGYSATLQSVSAHEEEAALEGTPVGPGIALEYDLLGAFPVSRVNFVLKEPGFYKVRYLSRPQKDDSWQVRGETSLSMIRNPDGSVSSSFPIPVDARLEHRFWRLEFEGTFSGAPPEMRYAWRPREVVFLAQGRAPYILAFGSFRKDLTLQDSSFLGGSQLTVTGIQAEIGSLVDPSATPDLTPGGEKAGAEREEIGWQRYLVWGLLVLSALLLSAMAWKLMKNGC